MNQEKSAAYKKLVKDMWKIYPKYGKDPAQSDKVKLWAPYIDGENICQEINLYTYWQGLGYAEKTPRIKYLLVAQDFGNIFVKDSQKKISKQQIINGAEEGMEKFKKMDADKTILSCDSNNPPAAITDKNLIELFKILGYDILNNRYSDLFFTNFCLGYITYGKISYDYYWLEKDSLMFKRLCDILEPENILCLGKLTSECAYEALSGKDTWKKIYGGFTSYNDFIENHVELTVNCGKSTARFFPLAHCGGMGTANRNRNLPKQNNLLYYQKQDWAKIYEVNK